jgi:hypothetical protein
MINGRVDWYACHKFRMAHTCPSLRGVGVSKPTAISQNMDGSVGENITTLLKQFDELSPFKKRFTAGECERARGGVNEVDCCFYFVEEPAIVNISGWLRTHQAVMIAAFGYQE